MNSRISLFLNIVLTIAIIVLFVLYYKLNSKMSSYNLTPDTVSPIIKVSTKLSGNINAVYINIDTLLSKYNYIKEAKIKLETEQKLKQGQLEREYGKLQNEVEEFKQIAQRLSQEAGQSRQQELAAKEQNLMALRENLSNELIKKEQDMTLELQKKISNYLKRYKSQLPFNYVLSYGSSGSVLFANDSLDITKQVIDGLNKEYKTVK